MFKIVQKEKKSLEINQRRSYLSTIKERRPQHPVLRLPKLEYAKDSASLDFHFFFI